MCTADTFVVVVYAGLAMINVEVTFRIPLLGRSYDILFLV